MRRSDLLTISSLLCGASILATSALALPTELGRSADVHANAVRYFLMQAGDAMAEGPKARPAQLADVVTVAVADVPTAERIFTVPLEPHDLATVNFAGAMEDVMFQEPLVARDISTIDFAAVLQNEGFQAPEEPRDFSTLASSSSPETSDVVSVAFGTAPSQPSAGSSRLGDPTTADLIPVAGGAVASGLDGDFMDEMAAADSNFTIREGDDNRPDTMMMSSDVLFAFGKAALAPEAEDTLETMTKMFANVTKIEVFGHTDAIGSEANNLALGQKRAEVVRDWLLANSTLTPEQIIATGVGETDPVAANFTDTGDDNAEGRAQNRRVEFAFW